MAYGVIYFVEHLQSGKRYIGQTVDPERRSKEHRQRNRLRADPLYVDVLQYGIDAFSFSILEYAEDQPSLDRLEDYYIKLFNTLVPNGYNRRGGGNKGKIIDGTREKIKQAWADPDARARMLAFRQSDEGRRHFSERGKTVWDNPIERARRVAINQRADVNQKRAATLRATLARKRWERA